MKATVTSKGQITIPVEVRKKLGIRPGQVLNFDIAAPFLKAVPAFDEKRMRSVLGRGKNRLGMTAMEWMNEVRGPGVDGKPRR